MQQMQMQMNPLMQQLQMQQLQQLQRAWASAGVGGVSAGTPISLSTGMLRVGVRVI